MHKYPLMCLPEFLCFAQSVAKGDAAGWSGYALKFDQISVIILINQCTPDFIAHLSSSISSIGKPAHRKIGRKCMCRI